MTYIHHITLATGHSRRIGPGEVSGETLARVRPWLAVLTQGGKPLPLPVAALSAYTALGLVIEGALVVTISGPPSAATGGRPPPLATLGVARRSRHGAVLWPLLTRAPVPLTESPDPWPKSRMCTRPWAPPAHPSAQRPAEPWVAVTLWPTLAYAPEAAEWLGDLERCIAWAWCVPADGEDGDDDA